MLQLRGSTSSAARPAARRGAARRTPLRVTALFGGLFGGQAAQQQTAKDKASASQAPRPPRFPVSYDQAVRQAQEATKAALADGATLIEVEFPSASLSAVQGDGEGQNEMNWSMGYLRQYMGAWRDKQDTVRVIFPDKTEAQVARFGQTMDPAAGRAAMDGKFSDVDFKMGYLTKQNALWSMTGFNFDKWSPADLVKDSDELLVVAYPHFNPREEMSAVYEVYKKKAKPQGLPIVIFNGELDRLRGGYYPGLFFGELDRITKEFLPGFEQAYYIHNFKGTRPAALFRCYPHPWQVYRRNPVDPDDMKLVWQGDKMPTLKEVALEILPSAQGELQQ